MSGERFLEGGYLGTQDELTALDDPPDRTVQVGPVRLVLGLQVDERDHHVQGWRDCLDRLVAHQF